jgi:hypothetical protein
VGKERGVKDHGEKQVDVPDTYIDSKTSEYVCAHCGGRRSTGLPKEIMAAVWDMRGFVREHRGCKAAKAVRP